MVREPAVAGHFYSGDPRTLKQVIHSFLRKSDALFDAKAVVAPHAGYVYSGEVAGAVFSAVRIPKRFIILGPNHTGRGAPLALAPVGEWRTPLGIAVVDPELNRLLLEDCPNLQEDRLAHSREHSLEVQIPFLQTLAPEFHFAAICVGTADYAILDELGLSLAQVIRTSTEPILLVASSDMNHFESADVASQKDRLAIERILVLDPRGLYQVVRERDISMCGVAPAISVLTACRELGATEGRLIRYANSGDVSGDYGSVVGYAGLAIV